MTPAAYITETEEGDRVWLPEDYIEACTYGDDDEFPEPLYKSQAHVMQQVEQPTDTDYQRSNRSIAKCALCKGD